MRKATFGSVLFFLFFTIATLALAEGPCTGDCTTMGHGACAELVEGSPDQILCQCCVQWMNDQLNQDTGGGGGGRNYMFR